MQEQRWVDRFLYVWGDSQNYLADICRAIEDLEVLHLFEPKKAAIPAGRSAVPDGLAVPGEGLL